MLASTWAVPSAAGSGHYRFGHGRHLSHGQRSYGLSKRHLFPEGPPFGIPATLMQFPFQYEHHRASRLRSRHHGGHNLKSRHFRRRHRSDLGSSYIYLGSTEPEVVVVEAPPQPEPQVVIVEPPPEPAPEPEGQWEVVSEWVPPVMERVQVPGYWAYGIKKTWTGDGWKFETDPDNKVWVAETYEWQEKQPGYYKEIQVLVR